MKSKFSLVRVRASRRFFVPTVLASALVFALMGIKSASGQTNRYWDQNGTTAGFGSATGTWTNPTVSRWSTSSGGTGTPGASVTTAIGDPTHFGTDTVGIGTGTVTVSGTVNAASIRFGSATTGNVILSGGTINLGATATVHVGAGSTTVHTISSTITGASTTFTKTGNTLQLSGSNSFTGQTIISQGTLILNNATALGGNTPGVNGTLSVTMAAGTTLQSNFAPADLGNSNSYVYAPITLTGSGTANFRIGAGNSTAPAEAVTFNLNGAISGVAGTNVLFGNTTGDRNNANSVIVLGAASTYNGNTTIAAGAANNRINVISGAVNALPATTVLSFQSIAGGGTGRLSQFELNGNNQTLAGLENGGVVANLRNDRVTNSGAPATLTINNSTDYSFGGRTVSTSTTNGNITGAIALTKSGTGTFTLTGNNSYSGATEITGGTLRLNAIDTNVGSINSSSGITINGLDAKLRQDSTTAITPAVTLTQGTLTGSGTVNTANVGNNTGGIVSNNNGTPGAAFTVGTLTFDGAATVNTFSSDATAPIVTTTLATNAAGVVTINPTAPTWNIGTPYDLISYGGGSIGGAGFAQFVLGAINGLSPRQGTTLADSGTAITLTINSADDPPYWVGDGDGKWNVASTSDWKLSSNDAYTTFLERDNVIFNDNATGAGPIAVDIDAANVITTSTTFNNLTKDYILGSTGGFGISAGNLTKSGSGTLTITNANSYSGNTTISGGVLDLSTDGAQLYSGPSGIPAVVSVGTGGVLVVKNFGQSNATGAGSPSLGNLNNAGGQVVIDGGTLRFSNEVGSRGRVIDVGPNGATLDVVNSSAYIWATSPGTSIPFTGTGQTLTLTGDSTSSGQINVVIGGTDVSLLKTGAATWTLGGTNTYTGNTTIASGVLAMTGNKIAGSPTIFIGDGATLRSTGTFILAANQNITGTGATGTVTHSALGTSSFQTSGGTTISTSGALTFSRMDVRGSGNVLSAGAVSSGGTTNFQRGLLVGNSVDGELTINAGASYTALGSGVNNADVLGVGTATGTLTIAGGSYTNSAGTATLQLGNNTGNGAGALNVNSGTASIGTVAYQVGAGQNGIVNLNGGTLTLGAMTSNGIGTREFNFHGGQFIAGGNASFPADVTANVKDGGALIDTNGFSPTIASPMVNFGGASHGGVTKSGLGTLTLAGVNTYTGNTAVNAGTLRFSTTGSSTSDVTVATGAESGALVATADAQWINTGDLALQNSATALVDYGSTAPSTTVAPISVADFTNGTSPGVRLAGGTLSSLAVNQTYPLITWSGAGPADGSAFSLLTHRVTGNFTVASNTLSVTITSNSAGAPISWNTGDGAWDTSTSNWLASDLTSTTYYDTLDEVLLGDASGATGNPVLTLGSAISPLGVTMNTSGRNYTITGAGFIGGSGGLSLPITNVGTLTIASSGNNYSGGTNVLGGTLVLGHATNSLPDTGAVVVDGATTVLNLGENSDTVGGVSLKNGASITGTGTLTGASFAFENGNVAANLAGSGNLTKTTFDTVTLSGSNSFTGSTTVSQGTLVLGNTAAMQGSSALGMSNGTTLHLATDTAFTMLPTIGGSSGASGITLISDRATPGEGLVHSLGRPSLGANTFNFTPGLNVSSGTAGFTLEGIGMSAGSAGTTVLNPSDTTVSVTGEVSINANNAAKTLELSGNTPGNQISGDIITNLNTLSVSKTGTSTWTLSGINSYNGTTTIGEGSLVFSTNDQTLPGGLTFGSSNGSAITSSLDLTGVSATFGGALTVRTNNVEPNTITIGEAKSLTVNGGLTMGYDAAGGTDATYSNLTVSGAGTMSVNGSTINVSVNQAAINAGYWSQPTLNVKGLAAFSTDVTTFNIGVGGNTQGPGTVLLSDTTNTILATNLTAGNSGGNNDKGTGLLVLGAGTNLIQSDTITIGRGKNVSGKGITGMIRFASQDSGSPGTVTITDKAGTGRANIDIANQASTSTGGGAAGTLDLRGHVATVSAGTVTMGTVSAGSSSGGPNGTISFDAGTFDVSTLTMSTKSGGSTGIARATVNIAGGVFTVNDAFTMGSQSGGGAANATVNLTGGTLDSHVSITKGTGNVTSTINLNGGTLDLHANAIGSVTETITLNAQSGTLQNLGEFNGGGALTKTSTGTVILAGANSYTGAATANEGTLSITGTLNPLSTLAVDGGTLSFSGTVPQTVSGLAVNAGSSVVTNTNAGTTNILNVGEIIQSNGGIVNFANATATDNVIQTITPNTNGILGPWAFVGTDFAMNDGSGNIVAYSGYADVTRLNPGIIADDATSNVRIVEGSGSAGLITLGAATTTVNTLTQSDSGGTSAATIDVATGTLGTDAILISALAGSLTVGTATDSGTLIPATTGGELLLTNHSPSNLMTINSVVADNISASSLSKLGAGTVVLNGTNTYTGATSVQEGTLRLRGAHATTSVFVNDSILQAAGNLPASAVVTLSGTGVLDLFGSSQTVASLTNAATTTLTNSNTGTHASTATAPGSPALTDALILSTPLAVNSLPLLITDGPTRKTQVVVNNTNSNNTFMLNNVANTFSGGLVLAHNATLGTRLMFNSTNLGVVGTGPVIIGEANTDRAGVYFTTAVTLTNDLVFNTALGTDRVGVRADAAVTLSGTITANLAPATFTSNSGTAGSVTITGQVTGASGLVLDITSLSAAATNFGVTLNNAGTPNSYTGDTVINLGAVTGKSATLNLGAAEQIPHGVGTGNVVINSNGTGNGTLNLGGFSETINGLSGNGMVEAGGGNPTLTLGENNANESFSGVIGNSTGELTLVKTGTGTQTFTGANSYTGNTTVSAGTLALVGGSQASAVTVNAGASLGFTLGSPTNSTSTFDFSAGTIKIIGSPTLPSYDLITSSAGITGTPQLDSPVAGYELKVEGNSLKLVQAGYASWAALNGAGANLNDDHDNDGVPNGVEYFLGGTSGNTTGATALPGVVNNAGTLSVTWVMGAGYAGVYGTDFTVETSDTLEGAWITQSSPGTVIITGSNVTYTFPAPLGTKKFARLKVTGP